MIKNFTIVIASVAKNSASVKPCLSSRIFQFERNAIRLLSVYAYTCSGNHARKFLNDGLFFQKLQTTSFYLCSISLLQRLNVIDIYFVTVPAIKLELKNAD